jgi:glucokinase
MRMGQENWELIGLGFDIGGSTTKLGFVSPTGVVQGFVHFPTDVGSVGLEVFLGHFLQTIRDMLARQRQEVAGIGGTFLGWIDEARSGPYLSFNALELHGLNLRKILSEAFNLPVALIDDTNAHTLAEFTFGVGRGSRRFMNLAMGTGLSAGIIIDGELLQFTGGCAGDTGHLILRPDGPACSAGCRGCGEALIGVEGIERSAQEVFGRPTSARRVIELARYGDSEAVKVIQAIGGYTGELLASLSHIFLPELISLSGGTAKAGQALLEAVRARFEQVNGDYHRAYSALSEGYYNGVEIQLGTVQGESGMIGAAVHLFNQLEKGKI